MSYDPAHLPALRACLRDKGLDGYVVWRGDMYSGEEVRPCDERLAAISGFTGSAGFALIMTDTAICFSDGRYHLQMQTQLDDAAWQWRDSGPSALQDALSSFGGTVTIGVDAATTTKARFDALPSQAGDTTLHWQLLEENLIDEVWHNRPAVSRHAAYDLSNDVTGQSAAEKYAKLQAYLRDNKQDGILISAPDCVNWLCNIRGDDLANTPFHLCFAYVPATGLPCLIDAETTREDVTTTTLAAFLREAGQLTGQRISYDAATVPMALYQTLAAHEVTLLAEACPITGWKASKNDTELNGFRQAHLQDAIAFCEFWYECETDATLTELSETALVSRLQQSRQRQPDYICDSFETIMGAGPNGAIIHYRAIEGQDSLIQNDSLLLIDSGGHYRTGTTDITRTLAVGTPTPEMRHAYSAVLAAHIALAMAAFPTGTDGAALDAICRAPLWAQGFDFAHGTGHGVGHILSVHEGPAHISKRGRIPLETAMILSNEPGYYKEGAFGIRLENLVAVTPPEKGFHRFETLTFVPFERDLIDTALLGAEAVGWLDRYHANVAELLLPHMASEEMVSWLQAKCAPLGEKG